MQTQQIMTEVDSDIINKNRTIVHEILQADNLPPVEKTFNRVNDEVDTITGAGLETVAQTLRLIIYYLYTDSKLLHHLRAELREVLQSPGSDLRGEPTLTQLERLPYLTAVIMEGLRLSPGLATRLARIAPDRDLVYNDSVIPAGTPISMTVLLIHWDESVYPNARKFEPERWMDKDRARKGERTFAPFSKGTRICLGMQ